MVITFLQDIYIFIIFERKFIHNIKRHKYLGTKSTVKLLAFLANDKVQWPT